LRPARSTTAGWGANQFNKGAAETIGIGRSVAGSGKTEVRRRADAQPNQALDQEKHEASGHEAAEQ
ncbi:MAG: hypothetical protein VYB14_03620, partial [Planctomycetota bacterium]|nr:hypothetical protein [Planctomycetota bacterium]